MGEEGVLGAGNITYVVLQKWQLNMAGPSRRMSTTQASRGSGSSRSDFNNSVKYYCNCVYEAVMYETDGNYRCCYLVCLVEVNCDSFILKLFNFDAIVVFYNSLSTVLTCVIHVPPRTTACRMNLPVNTVQS